MLWGSRITCANSTSWKSESDLPRTFRDQPSDCEPEPTVAGNRALWVGAAPQRLGLRGSRSAAWVGLDCRLRPRHSAQRSS